MPAPKEARERYQKLIKEVNRHRRLYYVQEQPEIADSAYDELERELLRLEERYPDMVSPDSPTRRGWGEAAKGFKKVRHEVAQWSFNDAFSESDIRDFDARVRRMLASRRGPASASAEA